MRSMIKLRVHHVDTFIEALMSEKFREEIYFAVGKGHKKSSVNGFCHSKKESRLTRKLLNSVADETKVRIVLGRDDLCLICTEVEADCFKPDSIWDDYDLLSTFELASKLTITIGFLKERYRIVKKYKSVENWRRKND